VSGSGTGECRTGDVINNRFAETLGYTLQELSPVTIIPQSITHPDDLKRSEETAPKAFSPLKSQGTHARSG